MQTIPIRVDENGGNVPISSEQMRVIEAVSPTVDAERVSGGVEITVHDLRGTQTAEVYDGQQGPQGERGLPGIQGEPGADGFSPIVTVNDITGGHRITVTDVDGDHVVDVMDGDTGATGNGIASTIMNADYTLTITYTNGQTYTTPSIRGEPGADYILTAEDKAEIIAAVLAVYPAAEGVSF